MSTRHYPTFSIVLPTYNRSAVVRKTLGCLLAMDYPVDALEIVVVDNSTDGTPDMVREVASTSRVSIRLVLSGERLPAAKRNQALRVARGEFALFLNDDVWVRPDFLREHARAHAMHDDEVAVLGRVYQSTQMPRTPFIEWYRPFAYDEIDHLDGQEVPYRYFWSMNISLRRSVMLDRNLVFHEDWREIGHEDIELGYRWTRAGCRIVYHSRASGEHFHPHTLDSACRLQASIGRGLRDLEALVPDPDLLARYGVFSWHNPPVTIARGLAREALFNRFTVPLVHRWLSSRRRNTQSTRWLYWKVLLHHTNAAYRATSSSYPSRIATNDRAGRLSKGAMP
jgi:GT2 family glycosyltransferase